MTLEATRALLGWCLVINFGVLLWWAFWFLAAHDWTYRVHSRLFPMPVETFNAIHYAGMAFFKLGLLLLNLTPYLALHIITGP